MRRARLPLIVLFVSCATASPLFADVTGFIGVNTTPDTRGTQGVAVGTGLLLIGFEFEFAKTSADEDASAPSLTTNMGNVLLQTPFAILGFQPYVTTGGGIFRERLGNHRETAFGMNTGAGVKISLAGPLRLRLDYRVFRLSDDALHSTAHRFYAGVNLKF
jgi:opacity protein-like surface antigen